MERDSRYFAKIARRVAAAGNKVMRTAHDRHLLENRYKLLQAACRNAEWHAKDRTHGSARRWLSYAHLLLERMA
jgi:hypothetical protein